MGWGLLGLKSNGSSAVAVDSNPNSVAPSAARIFTMPARTSLFQGALTVCADQNCVVTVWAYEDNIGKWIALQTGLDVTGGSVTLTWGLALASAKMFVQVVTNAGHATYVGAQVV